jgi:uncharacterized protein (TIGR00297 family)
MMIDSTRLLVGLALALAAGGTAHRLGWLTGGGALLAGLLGAIILGFGGWVWAFTLGICFALTGLFSRLKQQAQRGQDRAEQEDAGRNAAQVLASGGATAAAALAHATLDQSPLLLAAFAGALATVTADTWASDLGIFSPQRPRRITTGEPVARGAPGGVTWFGVAVSVAAGLVVGGLLLTFSALLELGEAPRWWLLPSSILGGLSGSLMDSVLAATVQARYRTPDGRKTEAPASPDGTAYRLVRGWRWMNNNVVNGLSSLLGGSVAAAVAVPFV